MQPGTAWAFGKSGGTAARHAYNYNRRLGSRAFTAEITQAETRSSDYADVFTVGDKVYDVSGFYSGASDEEEAFIFEMPLDELQPTVSPVEFHGLTWSGSMTESMYSGG